MTRRRKPGERAPIYDPVSQCSLYTIKLNHGGDMIEEPFRHYINGKGDYFDYVEADEFGAIELLSWAEELGYEKDKTVSWHKFGHTLHLGARVLNTDEKIYGILKELPQQKEHEIYLLKFELPDVEGIDEWEIISNNLVMVNVEFEASRSPSNRVTPIEAAKPPSKRATPTQAAKPPSKRATPIQAAKPPKPPSKIATPTEAAKPPSKGATPTEAAKPPSKRATPNEPAKPSSKRVTPNVSSKPSSVVNEPTEVDVNEHGEATREEHIETTGDGTQYSNLGVEDPVVDFSFLDEDPLNKQFESDEDGGSSECDEFIDSDYDMHEDDAEYERHVDANTEFDGVDKINHVEETDVTEEAVKGGMNFITVPSLRVAYGNQASGSGSGKDKAKDGGDQAKKK